MCIRWTPIIRGIIQLLFRSYDAAWSRQTDPAWRHEGDSLDLLPGMKQTDSMGSPLVDPPMPPASQNLDTSSSDFDQVDETVTTSMSRPSSGEKDDVNCIEMNDETRILEKKMKFSFVLAQYTITM